MQFMLLFSRQGKLRLQKWYVPLSDKEKKKISRELVQTVLARKPKMCSFLEWRDLKVVYKRNCSRGPGLSSDSLFFLTVLERITGDERF
ncbi:AP-1 complex subunit sigma-2 [Liparis tanakae]|uniref:AP-1 complex subunit sigma-2 n=1 Tax=Liparis tanakae TaxID=230148 RepID=A0A4Z2GL93_9TELE|nr:AP-1 complex subunit sigma-2 [Liparis tanakae]